MSKDLTTIKNEINAQIADKESFDTLLKTTFNGLVAQTAKRAMLEGMMRGFEFKDFLEKNVYAIPFKDTYSLVTSIDYARKIGSRSGIVGKSAPSYEMSDDGKILSCSVTVQKKVDNTIGDYTATVFFEEYYSGHKNADGTIKKNKYGDVKPGLWDTKPRTMIAKVAEMHALRSACPEELAKAYIEEDYQQEVEVVTDGLSQEIKNEIDELKTVEEVGMYYAKNKGKGKEFDKYVTKRKKELEAA